MNQAHGLGVSHQITTFPLEIISLSISDSIGINISISIRISISITGRMALRFLLDYLQPMMFIQSYMSDGRMDGLDELDGEQA